MRIPLAILAAAACAAQTVDYVRDVRPILAKRCAACHGAAQQMNGLRLDDPDSTLRGGYSGPAVVRGNSAASRLVERVASAKEGVRMPPAGPPVPASEIEMIRRWIDQGAAYPAGLAVAPAARPKSNHWSFQRVARPVPPPVRDAAWARNPIDRFVLARLDKEGLRPSPEAPKSTLLRRASLDLTGLPPNPRDLADFLADSRPDAYERAIDRLLQSPHYGERWARHWLDLAHYADSDGYEKDLQRPWAWRYRHWLIDAINRDLPFDQFTIEQLAGDLVPSASTDQLVATGFLRNTLTNREAGVDRDEARFEQIINRTNTVGTTWLGLGVGCAQCHDHKYDPIKQKDYYALFAFFDRTEEQDIDAPLPGELGPHLAEWSAYLAARKKLFDEYEVAALMPAWEAKILEAIDKPGTQPEWDFALTSMKAMFDRTVKVMKTPRDQRTDRDQRRLEDYFTRSRTSFGLPNKEKYGRLNDLRKKLDAVESALPTFSQAQAMTHDATAPPTRLRVRGQWNQLGIPVDADAPGFLPPMGRGDGTRMDLARWLVSRDNPLTARVAANRFWGEFFGRALVRTTEDFGAKGEPPTHPELLDWLAAEFMEPAIPGSRAAAPWSMKHLHRLIATSATYRQASNSRPELARDPENTLLARQARLRLPAETLRDSALSASGLLSTDIGGRSVKPPQPEGVAELGYGRASNPWKVAAGKDRYRRGLYIHFQRTTPYPMLMTFDAPDSSVACTRRARSNTPLQALNLLNDEVFFEAAQALAWRVDGSRGSFSEKLDQAFRLCLARPPSDAERDRLARYHDEQARIFATEKSALSPWVGVARVLLNLDEFITRE